MKIANISVFFLMFFSICSLCYADDIEIPFKDVCQRLSKEAATSMSPAGENEAITEKQREENFERERKMFKERQSDLRVLIQKDPKSVWADDAQYVIAILNVENPAAQLNELKILVEQYPEAKAEPWTQEMLAFLMPPDANLSVDARRQLISLFRLNGNEKLAKTSFDDAVRKYPQYEAIFSSAYSPRTYSLDQIKKTKNRYNENLDKLQEK